MATKTFALNGGNFGGQVVEVDEETSMIVIDTGDDFWLYDPNRHPHTKTADFVDVVVDSKDYRITQPSAVVIKAL